MSDPLDDFGRDVDRLGLLILGVGFFIGATAFALANTALQLLSMR